MTDALTGIVFLMSSLYGAGQVNAQTNQVAAVISSQATTTVISSSTDMSDTNAVEAYVRKEFASTPILIQVARCESTYRQYGKDGRVIRGIENPQDVGVMQINEKYHAATALKLGYDIYSLEGNVAYAKYLFSKFGASPWVYSSKCWAGSDIAAK